MKGQNELVQQAKILPMEKRVGVLTSFKETEFHSPLKKLLERIEPDNYIEITHGAQEQGNDLVIIRKDRYFGDSIIGVIVKSGKIGGRTKGRVDEIKSQIDQSLTSHMRLKGVVKPLFISEIWVIVAGEISGRAQKRLEREKKGLNIRIFDIKWLVEKFTDFYPEIFFDERIIGFLQRKVLELEEKHLFSKRGKNLSECFVEPSIAMVDVPGEFDEEKSLVTIQKRTFPFAHLKNIIRQRAKIILVGDPGAGKSVALTKFVIDRLRETWVSAVRRKKLPDQIKIPILFPANDFLKFTNSQELVKNYIGAESVIEHFKVIIMIIDGLDEVLPDQRNDVFLKAEDFSEQLNCALLISTRKIDFVKTPPIAFETYELLPFRVGQALKLFEKITSNTQILSALKDGLVKIEYQIPMCPLSLLLLIEIVESYKEIPASITELYDRFSDVALGRYDRQKGINVLFEYLIKKRFLSELAFKEFLKKKRMEMPVKEFNEFLGNYAHLYGWGKENLKGFIREIERAGILNLREPISFPHRSFLEYFGAFYIYDNQREFKSLEDFLTQIYFKDFWGNVAFFYIGLDRRVSLPLLTKIFEFRKKELIGDVEKFLSGKLLQAGWQSPASLKRQGIQSIIALAPSIREGVTKSLKQLQDTKKAPIPTITSDIFLMVLSELSLGSGMLVEDIKTVFDALSERSEPSYGNLYRMLSLLWSLQRFLNPQENRDLINKTLETLSKIPTLSPEDEAVAFIFLNIIEKKDEALAQILKRKLNRLSRKYPQVFKELLPLARKGFRTKSKKKGRKRGKKRGS